MTQTVKSVNFMNCTPITLYRVLALKALVNSSKTQCMNLLLCQDQPCIQSQTFKLFEDPIIAT
jgi:hypothetical protein